MGAGNSSVSLYYGLDTSGLQTFICLHEFSYNVHQQYRPSCLHSLSTKPATSTQIVLPCFQFYIGICYYITYSLQLPELIT
jgi:hypothetical protein